jgi:glycosyltransferase involved in cell wall biosynthesis
MSQQPIAVFASFSGAGGVERMLVQLLGGLVDLGQPVELVLVRDQSPYLAGLPSAVQQVPLGRSHTLGATLALARYLRRRQPRVLLAAKDRAGRSAVLARALAGTETPILLRLGTHLSTAMAERRAVERWLRYWPIRRLYPRLDGIIAVSEGVAADTLRISGVAPELVRVIRNPVITPVLLTAAEQPCPHPWLAPDRLQDAPPVILGAGRLQRQKDFPTLLRAFARLRQRRPCRLLILGEGSGRAELEQLIAALGIGADVDLPGFQPAPYPFMRAASLFVLSSAWEGSPNVLTEAMALGTPVVATDCPSGPAEILAGGRFGALVPVGDDVALADAMARTLERPLPATVLHGAVAEYNQASSARRYLEAIEDVVSLKLDARAGAPGSELDNDGRVRK